MRTKYTMKAPAGVTESIIDGQPYWPDPDTGLIETINPNHIPVLKLHGYVVTGQVSMMPPPRVVALPHIDTDEFGRSQLIAALVERGLSYPDGAGRDELVDIAKAWNAARVGPKPTVLRDMTSAGRDEAGAAIDAAPGAVLDLRQAINPDMDDDTRELVAGRAGGRFDGAGADQAKALVAAENAAGDFDKLSHGELRGWLAARGVPHQGNAAKGVLVKVAQDYLAAKRAAADMAEAV